MTSSNKKIVERSVKQLNTYGNGIDVLVSKETKAIGLKSGSRVQVSAIKEKDKEYIIIEEFPVIENKYYLIVVTKKNL